MIFFLKLRFNQKNFNKRKSVLFCRRKTVIYKNSNNRKILKELSIKKVENLTDFYFYHIYLLLIKQY